MSAVATVPWCTPNTRTWRCDFCHKLVYDCACPRHPKCSKCGLDPEEADYIGGDCTESTDGKHEWWSEEGDSIEEVTLLCVQCNTLQHAVEPRCPSPDAFAGAHCWVELA
jgi:hypothetical protein